MTTEIPAAAILCATAPPIPPPPPIINATCFNACLLPDSKNRGQIFLNAKVFGACSDRILRRLCKISANPQIFSLPNICSLARTRTSKERFLPCGRNDSWFPFADLAFCGRYSGFGCGSAAPSELDEVSGIVVRSFGIRDFFQSFNFCPLRVSVENRFSDVVEMAAQIFTRRHGKA